jgi:hypothetical protein
LEQNWYFCFEQGLFYRSLVANRRMVRTSWQAAYAIHLIGLVVMEAPMSKNKATAIVAALAVAAVAVFALVFRDSATIRAILPFGTEVSMEGHNESAPKPGKIEGEGLNAGGNLNAENRVGGDVGVKDTTAKGDIRLSTQAPGDDSDPKD